MLRTAPDTVLRCLIGRLHCPCRTGITVTVLLVGGYDSEWREHFFKGTQLLSDRAGIQTHTSLPRPHQAASPTHSWCFTDLY